MRYVLFLYVFLAFAACDDTADEIILAECDDPAYAHTERCQAVTPLALPTIKTDNLPGFFDCVRDVNGLLIAAHRAGPVGGFPENAIETLKYGFSAGIRVFEVDVATSRDGVLFLLHDRSLGRTTTGDGSVANTDWSEISQLSLRDNNRRATPYTAPRLEEALVWATETGAILELDKKETTGWRSLILAVRAAGAENNVLLITYSDEDAALVQRLAPEMMLTTGARGSRDLGRLEDAGVNPRMVIAWTGTDTPDPAAWNRLAREGVEPAFGTLGRSGERLDDAYWADGDGSEYETLVENGVVLLATDEPYRVTDWLKADERALNACGG